MLSLHSSSLFSKPGVLNFFKCLDFLDCQHLIVDIIDQGFCNQEFSIKDRSSSRSRQNIETYQNFQVSTEFLILIETIWSES